MKKSFFYKRKSKFFLLLLLANRLKNSLSWVADIETSKSLDMLQKFFEEVTPLKEFFEENEEKYFRSSFSKKKRNFFSHLRVMTDEIGEWNETTGEETPSPSSIHIIVDDCTRLENEDKNIVIYTMSLSDLFNKGKKWRHETDKIKAIEALSPIAMDFMWRNYKLLESGLEYLKK